MSFSTNGRSVSFVLSTADQNLWKKLLPAQTAVFGSVEYASIAERYHGYDARLFVFERDKEQIVYPLLLRPLADLPFGRSPKASWDVLSPSFTGPISKGPVPDSWERFDADLAEYCRQEGIVTEFAHLHPWRQSPYLVARDGLNMDREIVYVDLSWSEDELWKYSFAHSCRKNITRARESGVELSLARTAQEIRDFHRIYTGTMERNQAAASYYFPQEYFLDFFHTMPDHCFFMLARHRGTVIAGTLYLHDGYNIYSYLGGADHRFQELRPTNAVIHETIQWGRKYGKRRLILGGGYRPDDGIFRFKSTFSPFRARFYVFKRIHLKDEYARLCRAWSDYHASDPAEVGYFPAYRSLAHGGQSSYAKS
jgi:hypothetical protein